MFFAFIECLFVVFLFFCLFVCLFVCLFLPIIDFPNQSQEKVFIFSVFCIPTSKNIKINDHINEIVLELLTLKSADPYERALWENYRKDDIKVITKKEC